MINPQKSVKKLTKYRSKHTALAIINNIAGITAEQLITELFVYTDDPFSRELIKKFESQLITCKLNEHKFKADLHGFFEDNNKYLGKNRLYKKLLEFANFIYLSFVSKNVNKDVFHAYSNLLIQQYTYIRKEKIVYGIGTDQKLFVTSEIYPKLDIANHEFTRRLRNTTTAEGLEKCFAIFKKYGYVVNNIDELEFLVSNEQAIVNMLYHMAYYISEDTIEFYPYPYYPVAAGIKNLPRKWKDTAYYLKQLDEKTHILPSEGVKGILKNAGDFTEIYFKEIIIGEKLTLLFKIKFPDKKYISGFYDHKTKILYSPWKHSSGEELCHNPVENFVLELYVYLTTDIAEPGMTITSNIKNVIPSHETPVVQFLTRDRAAKTTYSRTFNKADYQVSLKLIRPFIRQLLPGQKASDEAKSNAMKFGYELKAGETFVNPHKRTVYRK